VDLVPVNNYHDLDIAEMNAMIFIKIKMREFAVIIREFLYCFFTIQLIHIWKSSFAVVVIVAKSRGPRNYALIPSSCLLLFSCTPAESCQSSLLYSRPHRLRGLPLPLAPSRLPSKRFAQRLRALTHVSEILQLKVEIIITKFFF